MMQKKIDKKPGNRVRDRFSGNGKGRSIKPKAQTTEKHRARFTPVITFQGNDVEKFRATGPCGRPKSRKSQEAQ